MPARRTKLLHLFCWLIIVLALAGAARSFFAMDKVSHVAGELFPPEAAAAASPPGPTPWWRFHLRTVWALTIGGDLAIGVDHYDSLGPDGDELSKQWANSIGFASESHRGQGLVRSNYGWFAWSWPQHVAVFGAGTIAGSRQGVETRAVVIPLWMIAALAATPLVISWHGRRRFTRRLASGHCTRCGYNRAGVPADRACPECGAPPSPPAPAPSAATNA